MRIDAALKSISQGLGEKAYCVGTHFSLADIAVGCALGYLDFRFPENAWRTDYPNMARLADKLAARQSFIDTVPPWREATRLRETKAACGPLFIWGRLVGEIEVRRAPSCRRIATPGLASGPPIVTVRFNRRLGPGGLEDGRGSNSFLHGREQPSRGCPNNNRNA